MKQRGILFVCSGNTCRSVIAEALFQFEKEKLFPELPFQAYSAGISAIKGDHATREAILSMAKYGIDITKHRSRMVEGNMITQTTYILTMTYQQLNILKKSFPMDADKIFLMRPFCYQNNNIKNKEVEDPFGSNLHYYEKLCFQMKKDIKKLINYIRKGL